MLHNVSRFYCCNKGAVCLHLYAKERCMQNSTALFYLQFYIRDSSIAQKMYPRSLRSIPFYNIGIKDIFECFMMVLNYRAAALKPRSLKG